MKKSEQNYDHKTMPKYLTIPINKQQKGATKTRNLFITTPQH